MTKEITVEQLAAALASVGPAEIEHMAWSPLKQRFEADPEYEHNVYPDDDYPMASLARAIWIELR